MDSLATSAVFPPRVPNMPSRQLPNMVPLKVLALVRTEYADAIRGLLEDLIQFLRQKRMYAPARQ